MQLCRVDQSHLNVGKAHNTRKNKAQTKNTLTVACRSLLVMVG